MRHQDRVDQVGAKAISADDEDAAIEGAGGSVMRHRGSHSVGFGLSGWVPYCHSLTRPGSIGRDQTSSGEVAIMTSKTVVAT
jgi:hypothetical protein